MKKKYLKKKLQLNKETVSSLNFYEMQKIAGGDHLGVTMATNSEIDDSKTEPPPTESEVLTCEASNIKHCNDL